MAMTRAITMFAYDEANAVDVAGPLQVFATANDYVEGAYQSCLVAPRKRVAQGTAMRMSNGLQLQADRFVGDAPWPMHTLLIAGGQGSRQVASDTVVLRWLTACASRATRVASVCTGAFVLAAAGLLDGRRAVTHWRYCQQLAEQYPDIDVDVDAIYVRDGNIFTSAGVSAGMDLALALVEDDLGREVARKVAQDMVLFLHRPGGQSQFSMHLEKPSRTASRLDGLRAFIAQNLHDKLSVEGLANEVAMSARHFARVFRREFGATPAKYIEQVRIETARRLLEASGVSVEEVALRCGYKQAENMRRSFLRTLRVTPSAYRQRFRSRIDTSTATKVISGQGQHHAN